METHETEMVEAQGPGGLSRRDLITRTAVAGGLMWAAPVLLASPASATHDACACHDGLVYYIKIASQQGVNCGNITCTTRDNAKTAVCGTCLIDQGIVVIADLVFQAGTVRFSSITLGDEVELVEFCAQTKSNRISVNCPGFEDPSDPDIITVTEGGKRIIADPATPLNEVGLILCAPAGTPPPGC
ncbi:MAG TPA: twin-arginine translocation signal domain-containing protein [Acidimicrobiales bacterium]|nr:twin-arginine translocation signal domain-containing protein [Acidimicrobiales bacterium]